MSALAMKQLTRLQQSLYDRAYSEAQATLGYEAKSIARYSRRFESILPSRFKYITKKSLISHVLDKNVILCGDFHSHKQAQRGFLRLVRTSLARSKGFEIVVALEMFRSKDQAILDAYIDGKLNDQELLSITDYQRNWGFPWKNYKPILDFARENSIKVLGINTNNAGRDSLAARDAFSARLIAECLSKNRRRKIFCLVGEYHLADEHLPQAISRELRNIESTYDRSVTRIIFNADKYYFRMSSNEPPRSEEFLKLRADLYCIINSSPWVKWQSHAIWEESRKSNILDQFVPDIEEHEELSSLEDDFDLDYHFLETLKSLRNFFELRISDSDLARFKITRNFAQFFTSDLNGQSPRVKGLASRIATRDGWYVDYGQQNVLISTVSVNNLAESAGQVLHALLIQEARSKKKINNFFLENIFCYALSVLASRILNPRRPTISEKVLKKLQKDLKGRRLADNARAARYAAKGALLFLRTIRSIKTIESKGILVPKGILALELKTGGKVSEFLGQVVGGAIYEGLLSGQFSKSDIRAIFRTRLNKFTIFSAFFISLVRKLA